MPILNWLGRDEALNKHNFAIVKYDSGKYTVIEV